MTTLCYLNGRTLPLAEARIDPQDRGFLFGDSLYEVVKVVAGTVLHLEPHIERLERGLARIEIARPAGLAAACHRLAAESGLDRGYLYLQVTRGVSLRSHLPPEGVSPTVLVIPYPYEYRAPADRRMKAVTVPDWRWEFRDLKTTSLLATVLGKLRARQGRVDEVLFRSTDGDLREGGSTNLFAVREGVLETHPADGRILEGVTRHLLIELAREAGIDVRERPPQQKKIGQWQEAFLCGTLTGVQPLVEIDQMPIADGEIGPMTRRLAGALDQREMGLLAAE